VPTGTRHAPGEQHGGPAQLAVVIVF
jgi:hypothetical protein